jgi:hypothetical protein
MKALSIISLTLLIAACQPTEDGGGMGGGGTANAINQSNGDSDGGSSDDTGAYGSPPTITEVNAMWDENAEGDWQILVSVSYTDADNDLDGGKVGVSAEVAGQVTPEQWFMIDGNEAMHDAEAGLVDVTLLLDQAEADPGAGDVTLMLRLKDAALNVSEEYSVTPS